MRGKKLLDYINFQKRFLNRICFNFLNRQNGCYLYWFWKETKIEEIHYILKIVTKKMMCKLRQYANVQSEITLVSWHDNLPASQFDSYIYSLNMKQGPEVSRHESELNTNCQTLVERSFTTFYRSGRAWSLHSSIDAV